MTTKMLTRTQPASLDSEVSRLLAELPAATAHPARVQTPTPAAAPGHASVDAVAKNAAHLARPEAVAQAVGRALELLPPHRRANFRDALREVTDNATRSIPAGLFGELFRAARDNQGVSLSALSQSYGKHVDPWALGVAAGWVQPTAAPAVESEPALGIAVGNAKTRIEPPVTPEREAPRLRDSAEEMSAPGARAARWGVHQDGSGSRWRRRWSRRRVGGRVCAVRPWCCTPTTAAPCEARRCWPSLSSSA